MSASAISVRSLSKRYRLGGINRHTLVDEATYWWHKLRGKDPREHFHKIGHSATERRRVEAETRDDKDFWALRDVSFDVRPGEVVGVIGRNGAGKSTLLKILTRITEPTAGEITLNGRVASLLEVGTGFHPELTGRENIYMNGAILGMKRREIAAKFDEIVEFSEIAKFIDTPVKRYSSGMYVRLAFAVAAHLEPEILLVDEVLAVGDAAFQAKCIGKMGEVAKQGRTVLFVSHQLAAVENLCGRCLYLDQGSVAAYDETGVVLAQYAKETRLQENLAEVDAPEHSRSGTGEARVVGFHVEDGTGMKTTVARSGAPVVFAFTLLNPGGEPLRSLDVGFSLKDEGLGTLLTVLYASYQGRNLSLPPGKSIVRCRVDDFPFAAGRYRVNARLAVAEREVDWLEGGVGWLAVEAGDYYRSGRAGHPKAPFLLRGGWSLDGGEGGS